MLNVARYDVFKLGEAVLAGQVARALRMLDGLQAEGEAAVLVHWTLAEDIRALKRVQGRDGRRQAAADGAARGARVGRQGDACSSACCRCCRRVTLANLLQAAHVCDGIVKGLKPPGWPTDSWQALQRLATELCLAFRPPR